MPLVEKKISSRSQAVKKGRMRCFPTRYGWIFIVIVLGMLVGSTNYNNNLGFLFTFLLISMAAVSLHHSYRNFAGIQVESVQTWPVFEKQPAVFRFHIREISSPRFAIRFELSANGEMVTDLRANTEIRVTVSIPTEKRGLIAPDKLVMSSFYPFGLVEFRTTFDLSATCVVYPRPVPVHQLTARDLLQAHGKEGSAPSSAEDFKGLRAYQNGDPIQHIFWKAYSKGMGLMIKEFTGDEAPSLFLNWHKVRSQDVEKKLSILCGMVLKAHGLKLKYGLKLPAKAIFPERSEQHKHRCLQSLALF